MTLTADSPDLCLSASIVDCLHVRVGMRLAAHVCAAHTRGLWHVSLGRRSGEKRSGSRCGVATCQVAALRSGGGGIVMLKVRQMSSQPVHPLRLTPLLLRRSVQNKNGERGG